MVIWTVYFTTIVRINLNCWLIFCAVCIFNITINLRRQQVFDQTTSSTHRENSSVAANRVSRTSTPDVAKEHHRAFHLHKMESPRKMKKQEKESCTTVPRGLNKELWRAISLKLESELIIRTVTVSHSLQQGTVKSVLTLHGQSEVTSVFLPAYWLKLEAPTTHGETDQSH